MDINNRWQPVLKTVVILDLLKDRLGSDYKTAQLFGIRPQRIYAMRTRGIILNDEFGLKAAQALDFPEDAMLLSLAAERAMNTESAKVIQRLAEQHYPSDFPRDSENTPSTEKDNKTGSRHAS